MKGTLGLDFPKSEAVSGGGGGGKGVLAAAVAAE